MKVRHLLLKKIERFRQLGYCLTKILTKARESLKRKCKLGIQGYDFDWMVKHMTMLLYIVPKDLSTSLIM